MFEQTFVQGTGELRKPWTLAVSIAGQALAVAALLAIPLLQPGAIAWKAPVILYAPPRVQPPPIKVAAAAAPQTTTSLLRAIFRPAFTAPSRIPAKIAMLADEAMPASTPILGIASGDGVGLSAAGLSISAEIAPPKPAVPPAPAKPKPISIRVGTGVQQALLIQEVRPSYPPLAKAARVSGAVRIAAVIARDGTIQNLQLIGGPPLLVNAALDAVRQWRYKPTLLSGEPVEVVTEITVNFTLSN